MTSMLMHLLMAALLIFLGYCLGRSDEAMADARRKFGAGGTAPEGHNDLLIWVNGAEGHFAKEADLVITVEDMRHILDAANILGKQP